MRVWLDGPPPANPCSPQHPRLETSAGASAQAAVATYRRSLGLEATSLPFSQSWSWRCKSKASVHLTSVFWFPLKPPKGGRDKATIPAMRTAHLFPPSKIPNSNIFTLGGRISKEEFGSV